VLFIEMRYLHATSGGLVPSSIRIVGGCAASWTMTASWRRTVDPVTTSRIGTPVGMASVSPFRSMAPCVGCAAAVLAVSIESSVTAIAAHAVCVVIGILRGALTANDFAYG